MDAKGLVMLLVIVAVVLGAGAIALEGFQNATNNASVAYSILGSGLQGLSSFGSLLGVIGTIAGVAVLLFMIFWAFGGQQTNI
jgi:hypothetical protein